MAETGVMSIGVFARLTGLTTSALRFYDDAGLLDPARVDPLTGYRLYSELQAERATTLRQLREIGMSLPMIDTFFTASPDEAARLIDVHVARVATETAGAQHVAAALKDSLGDGRRVAVGVLPGPVLAAAIDQVLATTIEDPDIPVLGGARLEAGPDGIALIATDRYRLAQRTLMPRQPSAVPWAGTLAGDDLRAVAARLRRSSTVSLEAGERTLRLRLADDTLVRCRLLDEDFPDHQLLFASLPRATHRLTVEKQLLFKELERRASERVGMRVSDGQPVLLLGDEVVALKGTATGHDLTLWFELTTLYPALSHALGNDLMLDLHGPDQPVVVRSADDGDLTLLVMPCRAAPTTTGPIS